MSEGITYIGDASWAPLGNPEPSDPPNELPTTREQWIGRSDQLNAFRAAYAVGTAYLGGYISDNTPRANQPFYGMDTVELLIIRPPDFSKSLSDPSLSLKTASKSANVSGTNIIPPALIPPGVSVPNPIPCTRTVSFYAPEMRYRYFSSARPSGARFSSAGSGDPVIISSKIVVQLSSGVLTFAGNAPADIVTALHMPTIDMLTGGPEGTSIKGTPGWFDVTEVWSRMLAGDS